jgi:hypothetical protein
MSRRQERSASRCRTENGYLADNLMWYDLCLTYHRETHAFLKGCGQSTLATWVRQRTGRLWPSHKLRKVLNEAVRQHYVERIRREDCQTDCACFRFIIFRPLQGDPQHDLRHW